VSRAPDAGPASWVFVHQSTAALRMGGNDRQDFLHRLSTNDILGLKAGAGCFTLLLNTRGRILDLLHVMSMEDHLLIIASPGGGGKAKQHLEQYLFREAVSIEPADSLAGLGLYGPGAGPLLGQAAGGAWDGLPLCHHTLAAIAGEPVLVARTWPLAGSGFLVLCPGERTQAVLEALTACGALAASSERMEYLRVEALVPGWGTELSEDFNPWEISLDGAISLTKGCYLGQEVVARLHSYRKVQRRLVGLEIEAGSIPVSGSPLLRGSETVGLLTSVVGSQEGRKGRGMAVLKSERCIPGEMLTAGAQDSEVACRVREALPPLASGLAEPV